uniref:Uncharacterized protein n=1 Tax=Anguilla anguilla TaxID=7936 RepID=A0A0E9QYJ3_ANGAN
MHSLLARTYQDHCNAKQLPAKLVHQFSIKHKIISWLR